VSLEIKLFVVVKGLIDISLNNVICKLESDKRRQDFYQRALFMLTCFADDSGSDRQAPDKQSPVFVLAGYVSTVDNWKKFSNEWKAALKSGPRELDYFKMVEAHSLKEQFCGWTKYDRDEN
jgi:hypothetical protein